MPLHSGSHLVLLRTEEVVAVMKALRDNSSVTALYEMEVLTSHPTEFEPTDLVGRAEPTASLTRG